MHKKLCQITAQDFLSQFFKTNHSLCRLYSQICLSEGHQNLGVSGISSLLLKAPKATTRWSLSTPPPSLSSWGAFSSKPTKLSLGETAASGGNSRILQPLGFCVVKWNTGNEPPTSRLVPPRDKREKNWWNNAIKSCSSLTPSLLSLLFTKVFLVLLALPGAFFSKYDRLKIGAELDV